MATIQNERDKLLQAAAVRFILPTIPTSQVDGLDGWMGDVNDALGTLGQDIEHLMNTSSAFSIRANGLVFTNTSGTTTPSTITLNAVRGEGLIGGTVAWSVFAGSATLSDSTGESTTVTGSTVSGRSATIRARLTVAGVNHDAYVTITRLGAVAASNAINLSSQVTGQLANNNVSGLGALALLNSVDLNTQTVGALNGLTQVTNLGNLAYANAIAANQIGAGQLAAGVIYAGMINVNQLNAGFLVGFEVATKASGVRIEMREASNDIRWYPASGGAQVALGNSGGGLLVTNSAPMTISGPSNLATLILSPITTLPASGNRPRGGMFFHANNLYYTDGTKTHRILSEQID